ncbi:uncharacterized protein LOC142981909 [Anticarsia gemmatalis]|uniref:uncharacterized protein LOC142981909 n=1 Tax=Anticarsia gemmatalis TaxID=129554 RepID=UPI003F768D8A
MFSVKLVALFFIVSVAVSWIPGSPNTGVALAAPRLHIDGSTTIVNNGDMGQVVLATSRDGGETASKLAGLAHMGDIEIDQSNNVVNGKDAKIHQLVTIAANQRFTATSNY